MCAIAAAHFLVLRSMLVSDGRGVRMAEGAPDFLFFIEIRDDLP